MKRWELAIIILLAIAFSFAVGAGYSTYETGYDHGYSKGCVDTRAGYPNMTLEGFTFATDNIEIYCSSITVSGEQEILDMVKNMPNIIEISTADNRTAIGFKETGIILMEFADKPGIDFTQID